MIKEFMIKILPDGIVRIIYNKLFLRISTIYAYQYDRKRYSKYSDSFLLKKKTELLGNIIKHYHVIEKGLSMPEIKLGFGQPKLIVLINECLIYLKKFGNDDDQVMHAISVIKEYSQFHVENNYPLLEETKRSIDKIKNTQPNVNVSKQITMTRERYFESVKDSFDKFSNSRSSIRNYSNDNVSIDSIKASLELARNTPSACNRQSWRTYIYEDNKTMQEILEVQGGNRGFGHLTNKLIVVTAELGVFGHSFERNQAFIDGGMYMMNLLYALHYNKIAACPLNCSNTPKKDLKLHKLCQTNLSEVFIAMISCGIPPKTFKMASSPRDSLNKTNTFNV